MLMKPSYNFLNWYKNCCNLDLSIYKKTAFNDKKANVFYKIAFDKDYIIYPLDGSEKIFCGKKDFCEDFIQNNLNTRFLIFNLKKDDFSGYSIKNNKVTIF